MLCNQETIEYKVKQTSPKISWITIGAKTLPKKLPKTPNIHFLISFLGKLSEKKYFHDFKALAMLPSFIYTERQVCLRLPKVYFTQQIFYLEPLSPKEAKPMIGSVYQRFL